MDVAERGWKGRARLTPPQRGFRWFKSKNVVCLEHYRRLRDVTERKVSWTAAPRPRAAAFDNASINETNTEKYQGRQYHGQPIALQRPPIAPNTGCKTALAPAMRKRPFSPPMLGDFVPTTVLKSLRYLQLSAIDYARRHVFGLRQP